MGMRGVRLCLVTSCQSVRESFLDVPESPDGLMTIEGDVMKFEKDTENGRVALLTSRSFFMSASDSLRWAAWLARTAYFGAS